MIRTQSRTRLASTAHTLQLPWRKLVVPEETLYHPSRSRHSTHASTLPVHRNAWSCYTLNGALRGNVSVNSSISLVSEAPHSSGSLIFIRSRVQAIAPQRAFCVLWLQEFLRRHGSTSKLCRKVRSADNLPLASSNRQQDPRRNSKDEGAEGDRESFLKPNQDDRSEDQDSRRQNSLDSAPKDNTETSLLDPSQQQPSSRWIECLRLILLSARRYRFSSGSDVSIKGPFYLWAHKKIGYI